VQVSLVQSAMTVQLVQARSVVAVQAALCSWPAGQAPLHGEHVVPSPKNPLAQRSAAMSGVPHAASANAIMHATD
jgi:hypothetical protein